MSHAAQLMTDQIKGELFSRTDVHMCVHVGLFRDRSFFSVDVWGAQNLGKTDMTFLCLVSGTNGGVQAHLESVAEQWDESLQQ